MSPIDSLMDQASAVSVICLTCLDSVFFSSVTMPSASQAPDF